MSLQERYDDAMFDFSMGNYDTAITKLQALVQEDPSYFDAQLSLGMAYFRQGQIAAAIAEGHKAEQLKPDEPLVHTNLSLFYLKNGDKLKAEQHGLKARVASWKTAGTAPPPAAPSEINMAQPSLPPPTIKKISSAKNRT